MAIHGTLAQWRKKANSSIAKIEECVWLFSLWLSVDAMSHIQVTGMGVDSALLGGGLGGIRTTRNEGCYRMDDGSIRRKALGRLQCFVTTRHEI